MKELSTLQKEIEELEMLQMYVEEGEEKETAHSSFEFQQFLLSFLLC